MGGIEQPHQVVGIVREIAVHLENVVVSVFERPLESGQVGRSQSQFALTFDQVQLPGILLLFFLHDRSRAVRRAVVDDQQVEFFGQRKDFVDHRTDVVQLVIGGNDYQVLHRGQRFKRSQPFLRPCRPIGPGAAVRDKQSIGHKSVLKQN